MSCCCRSHVLLSVECIPSLPLSYRSVSRRRFDVDVHFVLLLLLLQGAIDAVRLEDKVPAPAAERAIGTGGTLLRKIVSLCIFVFS